MLKTRTKTLTMLACLTLVLLALFCIGNTEVSAETYSGYCGGEGDGTNLTWTLDTETGVLEISGEGAMEDFDRYAPWWPNNYYITTVVISDNITNIGNYALYYCTSLKKAIIGDDVTIIGKSAFDQCGGLTSVILPDDVTSIGYAAFSGCTNLKSVTIPNNVTDIESFAFSYCDNLSGIIIPCSVTNIGGYAFYSCDNLMEVTIGANVTFIGMNAFQDCVTLTSVIFEATDGWCYTFGGVNSTSIPASSLMHPAIAASYLSKTYYYYDWKCTIVHTHSYTTTVTPPNCVNDGYTTYTCSCGDSYISDEVGALGHDYISLVTAPTCTTQGFTTYICTVCGGGHADNFVAMIPHNYNGGSCISCGKEAVIADGFFAWELTENGVLTVLGKGAMPDYSADTLPWLDYCAEIKTVVIGEGITTVGRCAFYGCSNLTSVEIASTVTAIGEYAFYGCSSLEEITIPASVTAIGKYAFRRAGLTEVNFEIGYGWFVGEEKLTVTELYGLGAGALTKAYYKLDWIRDVNADAEEIDPNFVAGGTCNSYTMWELVYIDETKTQMKLVISGNGIMPEYGTGGAPWYSYADSIAEIEVESGVTAVGRCAFYNLKNVVKVTLAEGIASIGDYAFSGCKALAEIDIPESVTSIGKGAFDKTGLAVIPTV